MAPWPELENAQPTSEKHTVKADGDQSAKPEKGKETEKGKCPPPALGWSSHHGTQEAQTFLRPAGEGHRMRVWLPPYSAVISLHASLGIRSELAEHPPICKPTSWRRAPQPSKYFRTTPLASRKREAKKEKQNQKM